MRFCSVVAVGLVSAAGSGALADGLNYEGPTVRCDFDAVEEVDRAARHIEVRPGTFPDPLDLFVDGEPIFLWIEEGARDCPIWPAVFDHEIGGLTIHRWGCGSEKSMLTFGGPDGQAVLSSHAAVGQPPRLIAYNAVGTCTIGKDE